MEKEIHSFWFDVSAHPLPGAELPAPAQLFLVALEKRKEPRGHSSIQAGLVAPKESVEQLRAWAGPAAPLSTDR